VVCDSGKRAMIGTNPIQQHLIQKLCNATNIPDIKGHIQVISNKVHAQLFAATVKNLTPNLCPVLCA
jgi:hypothetical protein